MKKIIFSLLITFSLFLTGCLDTTQEITLNNDGGGTISNTNDMSALIGLLKGMGGAQEMEKSDIQKIDSSFSLAAAADSIPNLTTEEKELVKKGTAHIMMNGKEEKFIANLIFALTSA